MNEAVFYSLAEVSMALAGFSGIAAALRLRGKNAWSETEVRVLWFLIIDSFLVVFFAFLPIILRLSGLHIDTVWMICSFVLGIWFAIGNFVGFQGKRRERVKRRLAAFPVISFLFSSLIIVAMVVTACLWLSVFNIWIPRGQAVYVAGLLVLMGIAALEFLFFIGRASMLEQKGSDEAGK